MIIKDDCFSKIKSIIKDKLCILKSDKIIYFENCIHNNTKGISLNIDNNFFIYFTDNQSVSTGIVVYIVYNGEEELLQSFPGLSQETCSNVANYVVMIVKNHLIEKFVKKNKDYFILLMENIKKYTKKNKLDDIVIFDMLDSNNLKILIDDLSILCKRIDKSNLNGFTGFELTDSYGKDSPMYIGGISEWYCCVVANYVISKINKYLDKKSKENKKENKDYFILLMENIKKELKKIDINEKIIYTLPEVFCAEKIFTINIRDFYIYCTEKQDGSIKFQCVNNNLQYGEFGKYLVINNKSDFMLDEASKYCIEMINKYFYTMRMKGIELNKNPQSIDIKNYLFDGVKIFECSSCGVLAVVGREKENSNNMYCLKCSQEKK
ncbi:MAG: hypothetical protein AABY32_02075 [Nanoarchaeota archaeon]